MTARDAQGLACSSALDSCYDTETEPAVTSVDRLDSSLKKAPSESALSRNRGVEL